MGEMVFGSTPEQSYYLLENQDGKTTHVTESEIGEYLEELFITPDQFVTLTPPKAQNGIRFIQACVHENAEANKPVEVELGIEDTEDGGTHLLYKMCSEEECVRIFFDYFDDLFRPNLGEYQPVQF